MKTPRNTELAVVLKNDPNRLHERVVQSEKEKLTKGRHRRKAKDLREDRLDHCER